MSLNREDPDSDTGNSGMSSNSDTEDSIMYNQGSIIENPEVHEMSNHLPEKEVPTEDMGNNMEMRMCNPKGDQLIISAHNSNDIWNE